MSFGFSGGGGSGSLGNDIDNTEIDSGSATNGQVLTANGSGGATWEDASGGGGSSSGLVQLNGIEEDLGLHWNDKHDFGGTLNAVNGICHVGNGIILAGTGSGGGEGELYRSVDFGDTWTQITLDSALNNVFAIEHLERGIVLVGTGGDAGEGDIWRSTDYGQTFTLVEMGANLDGIYDIAYGGNGVVICGAGISAGEGDVYRSTDYGATWSSVELDSGINQLASVEYLGGEVFLAGAGQGPGDGDIWRSTDNGASFTRVDDQGTYEVVNFIQWCGGDVVIAGVGYTTGDGDVIRSTDNGLNWSTVDIGSEYEYCYSGVHCGGEIVFVGMGSGTGEGDIYKSTDNGATFTLVEDGSSFGPDSNNISRVISLEYCGNGFLMAGTGNSNAYLFRSISVPENATRSGDSEKIALMQAEIDDLKADLGANTLRDAVAENRVIHDLQNGFVDEYADDSNINTGASSDQSYDSAGDYFEPTGSGDFDLVIQSNTTDGSTTFTDSINSRTITVIGDAQHDTAQVQTGFGTTSILMDPAGPDDGLSLADNDDWTFDADFSVDFWIRPANVSGFKFLIGQDNATTERGWVIYMNSDNLAFEYNIGGWQTSVTTTNPLTATTWQHVCVARSGTDIRIFVGGTQELKITGVSGTMNNANRTLNIGNNVNYTSYNGHMDEIRIQKGSTITGADSDSGFTPETALTTLGSNNMVLVNGARVADTAPDFAQMMILHEPVDAVTLNTDCTLEISRDNGVTWSTFTLSFYSDFFDGSPIQILETEKLDISSQPSDTDMVYRFSTLNETEQRIHGVWVLWQ